MKLIKLFWIPITMMMVSCGDTSQENNAIEFNKKTPNPAEVNENEAANQVKASLSEQKRQESEGEDVELNITLEIFRPLLKENGLSDAHIDTLFVLFERQDSLRARGLVEANNHNYKYKNLDEFFDVLENTYGKDVLDIGAFRQMMNKERIDTDLALETPDNQLPVESKHLRADDQSDISYVERELGQYNMYGEVKRQELLTQLRNAPESEYDSLMADYFQVSKPELELLKSIPAKNTFRTASEAQAVYDQPIPPAVEAHLNSGDASQMFKIKVNRDIKQRRDIKAGRFLKMAAAKKKEFYDMNPSWYANEDALADVYDSNQGGLVFLPLGKLSFADVVISHDKGKNNGGAHAQDALGSPNSGMNSRENFCNLGLSGALVLAFKDNVLIDVNGPDLFVFEVGQIETTDLYISENGNDWIAVGSISGGMAEVDIAEHVNPGQSFSYLKLVDRETQSPVPGADIDAVAAIGGALRLNLDSEVLFNTGKHELKPEGIAAVEALAEQIKLFPKGSIVIEGHTDDVGSDASNQTLSQRRAESVAKALKKVVQNPAFQWKEVGYGERKPIVPNDSDENRQKNRRVEILVMPY